MGEIDKYLLDFLKYTAGVSENVMGWVYPLTAAFAVALFSLLCTALFRFAVMPAVQKVTARTKATWDDYLFNHRVMRAFRRLIPPVVWYVCLPLVLAGMKKADARAKAAPLFERFGLAGCERKWPSELSGGMRQRAAFLRTYLMGADVTLLDEPFSALDALTRTDVRRWFVDVAAELGLSALVITHDVDEAVSMASRIYVLAGAPAAGEPSHVVGIVTVDRVASESFELTDEYLAAKREVMALLG